MKLSLTSWSYPACTLTEAWGITQAIGVGAIDIGLLHGAALDRGAVLAAPETRAQALLNQGIKVANVYWQFGNGIAERAVSDPAARPQNEADLDQVARFAKALGAATIFILPGVMRPGLSQTALIDQSAASLRALLPIAANHGVTLTVEPHIGGLLTSPALTLALLDQVLGLKLTLDYAHFICMGFTQDQIDPLAAQAAHLHLRQARPGALQAKWGEGTIDFGAVVERLRGCDYQGYLSLEYVHQDYMNTLFDDVLTETIRMRDLMRSYGVA